MIFNLELPILFEHDARVCSVYAQSYSYKLPTSIMAKGSQQRTRTRFQGTNEPCSVITVIPAIVCQRAKRLTQIRLDKLTSPSIVGLYFQAILAMNKSSVVFSNSHNEP